MNTSRNSKNARTRRDARTGDSRTYRGGRVSGRNEVRVQLPKQRLSWTFGGLTISARFLSISFVVVLIMVVLVPTIYQWAEQERSYRDILAEVEAAQDYNRELEEELQDWEDEDYIAQQARSRLGYVRPGETQYSVVDEEGNLVAGTSRSSTATAADSPSRPWTQLLVESILDADDLGGDAALDLQEQRAELESSQSGG